jgi:uncharacterized protein (DUF1778 family)
MPKANTRRKASTQKASRFSVRASATQKKVIAEAARITTISDFVLEQSLTAAQHVIADQVHFKLLKKQWKQFCEALDAPPKKIPALRRFLTKQGYLMPTAENLNRPKLLTRDHDRNSFDCGVPALNDYL